MILCFQQIVKLNLVEPILHVLFRLMSVAPDDENEEEYFPDLEESSTPSTVANQTLDVLALHLPPEKLLPLLVCTIIFIQFLIFGI